MIEFWMWSWILTAVGLIGFIFTGMKKWWGWFINLGCQALWIAYSLITVQYGFLASAVLYSIVFGVAAHKRTKERNVILGKEVKNKKTEKEWSDEYEQSKNLTKRSNEELVLSWSSDKLNDDIAKNEAEHWNRYFSYKDAEENLYEGMEKILEFENSAFGNEAVEFRRELEEAIVKSLETGTDGILIRWNPLRTTYKIEVTPKVPFGNIREWIL